ncbi:MAG: PIN domain-containing protein [Burkholderiales bacterium]
MRLLFDSVILIDHLNGITAATEYLAKHRQTGAISPITRAEVLTGVAKENEMLVKMLLDAFTILGLDKETADLAADLRREHKWKLPDAFQAALALQHDLKLATRNSRDFNPKRHAFVLIPYIL